MRRYYVQRIYSIEAHLIQWKEKTAVEIWKGEKPNLRIFGCIVYAHVPIELRKKLDVKAEKCLMMGYSYNGYRLWSLEKERIIVTKSVIFNENELVERGKPKHDIVMNEEEEEEEKENNEEEEKEEDNNQEEEIRDKNKNQENIRRASRGTRLPKHFNDFEMYTAYEGLSFLNDIPTSFKNIEGREDSELWRDAVRRELDSIEKNETWELIKEPKDVNVIDSKWVFAIKENETEVSKKYKARLVARGFQQENDLNGLDVYAPVTKMNTIRTLFAVGVEKGYKFCQLDVNTAFLNGNLEEDVYLQIPEGCKKKEGCVYKLKKSLYGLRQSA